MNYETRLLAFCILAYGMAIAYGSTLVFVVIDWLK